MIDIERVRFEVGLMRFWCGTHRLAGAGGCPLCAEDKSPGSMVVTRVDHEKKTITVDTVKP